LQENQIQAAKAKRFVNSFGFLGSDAASTAESARPIVGTYEAEFGRISLAANPQKCAALHDESWTRAGGAY